MTSAIGYGSSKGLYKTNHRIAASALQYRFYTHNVNRKVLRILYMDQDKKTGYL